MKHAILITAHNNIEILLKTMQLYDSEDIDFYIHIDKKAKQFEINRLPTACNFSEVNIVECVNVYWSDFSQIEAELILLKASIKGKYDYFHFISGVDIPLKGKTEFLDFFEQGKNYEYVEFSPQEVFDSNEVINRVKYYYLFLKNLRSNKVLIRKLQTFLRVNLLKTQKLLNMNRLKRINIPLKYGSNWFSITSCFANYVIDHEQWIINHFKHSSCGDELFLQTLLYSSEFYKNNYYTADFEKKIKLGRYVDWNRGDPYIFQIKDFEELKQVKDSFFARKFDWHSDSEIVEAMYAYLKEKEN